MHKDPCRMVSGCTLLRRLMHVSFRMTWHAGFGPRRLGGQRLWSHSNGVSANSRSCSDQCETNFAECVHSTRMACADRRYARNLVFCWPSAPNRDGSTCCCLTVAPWFCATILLAICLQKLECSEICESVGNILMVDWPRNDAFHDKREPFYNKTRGQHVVPFENITTLQFNVEELGILVAVRKQIHVGPISLSLQNPLMRLGSFLEIRWHWGGWVPLNSPDITPKMFWSWNLKRLPRNKCIQVPISEDSAFVLLLQSLWFGTQSPKCRVAFLPFLGRYQLLAFVMTNSLLQLYINQSAETLLASLHRWTGCRSSCVKTLEAEKQNSKPILSFKMNVLPLLKNISSFVEL